MLYFNILILFIGILFIFIAVFNILFPKLKILIKSRSLNNTVYNNLKNNNKKKKVLINISIMLLGLYFVFSVNFTIALPSSHNSSKTSNSNCKHLQNIVDDNVNKWLKNNKNSCLSLGIYYKGKKVVLGYGNTDVLNPDSSTPDGETIFQIGSITKVFTATLLADLDINNIIEPDMTISELLPNIINKNIRIIDLITHHSGLPRIPSNLYKIQDFLSFSFIKNPYCNYHDEDMYNYINSKELKNINKSNYLYSNLGYGLLTCCLSNQTNTRYDTLIKNKICNRYNMPNTTISLTKEQTNRLAQGYVGSIYFIHFPATNWNFPSFEGAGGLYSNTNDLLNFIEANLDNSYIYKQTHISQKKIGPHASIAWGWHILQLKDDTDLYWHNGMTGGFSSFIAFNKKHNIGIVLLANISKSLDDMAINIFQLLCQTE